MNSMFISGSRTVKFLDNFVKEIIQKCIANKFTILIGDCYGVDSLVQSYLKNQDYTDVIVYHIGSKPRFNAGFKTKRIEGNAFYLKDIAMSDDCENAFIIIENNSRGSLNNYNRVNNMQKTVLLYENDEQVVR